MNDEWQVTCAAVLVLKTTTDFDLVTVSAAGSDADTVRDLFLEYGESLSFNTCFGGARPGARDAAGRLRTTVRVPPAGEGGRDGGGLRWGEAAG
jgi:hypothetical protein